MCWFSLSFANVMAFSVSLGCFNRHCFRYLWIKASYFSASANNHDERIILLPMSLHLWGLILSSRKIFGWQTPRSAHVRGGATSLCGMLLWYYACWFFGIAIKAVFVAAGPVGVKIDNQNGENPHDDFTNNPTMRKFVCLAQEVSQRKVNHP